MGARAILSGAGVYLILAGAATTAAGKTCGDMVSDFAERQELHGAAPTAPAATATVTPNDLAKSNGVLKPPPVGDRALVPPPPTADPMPTAPSVRPNTPSSEPANQANADAAVRAQADALLTAARAAAERGDESACLDRLGEARKLLRD